MHILQTLGAVSGSTLEWKEQTWPFPSISITILTSFREYNIHRASLLLLSPQALPKGHPLKTLYLENKEIMKDAEMLNLYARTLANTKDERMKQEIAGVLEEIVGNLRNVGFTHYNREEMLIFPYIDAGV